MNEPADPTTGPMMGHPTPNEAIKGDDRTGFLFRDFRPGGRQEITAELARQVHGLAGRVERLEDRLEALSDALNGVNP